MIEILVNATIGGRQIWGPVNGLAARAYGICRCIQTIDWVSYTPVRFVDADGIPV